MQEKKPKDTQKIARSLGSYARYSNLAIQMLVIILIGVFGGIKLDQWLKMSFPVFTVVLSLAGIGTALYYGLKDFIKKK